MNNNRKNKHMTLEDRIEIQEGLAKRMTFKAIAERIGKDPTTVSKEVKRRARSYRNSFVKEEDCCPRLLKAPFVCNGCERRNHSNCPYLRRTYIARTVQEDYQALLVESREGVPLNKEEFYRIEKTISNAVKNGQHIYHVLQANHLPISKSTVYRHIEKGYYSISKLDLPRAVKFKPRKQAGQDYVPKGVKKDRSYTDFLAYREENPSLALVEMDTVIGRIGGKTIMTFQFVNPDFMFGLLLDNKSAAESAKKITALKQKLAGAGFSFGQIFPVLLTDNGGEFSNVFAFENDLAESRESRVFFCDPNAPYQKPHVENNHTLFRDIVPKGTSFDNFTQDTVNLIFSHVNGVLRKQFNGKSSYDMFTFTFSKELAALLGVSFVKPEDMIQSPKLLEKR